MSSEFLGALPRVVKHLAHLAPVDLQIGRDDIHGHTFTEPRYDQFEFFASQRAASAMLSQRGRVGLAIHSAQTGSDVLGGRGEPL